jgi:polyphosphate kinase
MLKTVLSVSGKPGLYQLVSHGKNMLIIESLVDKKRVPAYAKDKVISLGDIAIYTENEEVPLYEVLNNLKNKENGEKVSLNLSGATSDDLRNYFAEVLPDFDRDRVYPSDIKKLLSWYNILVGAGMTDFTPKEQEEQAEEQATENKTEE